uniref:Uncharacterized protein n=1 Tax=Cyclopterus lumpus TaxID=8103 RepID=A0A8C2Z5E8_CYCLU
SINPKLRRNNIAIFGMAVAYIINIFLSLWLVKYDLRAGKFLCIHSLRQFDFSRNVSITFQVGLG